MYTFDYKTIVLSEVIRTLIIKTFFNVWNKIKKK